MKIFVMLRLLMIPAVAVLLSACQGVPKPETKEAAAAAARFAVGVQTEKVWKDRADVVERQKKFSSEFTLPKLRVYGYPHYPPELAVQGKEGKVRASFLIDKQGNVNDVRILESTNRAFNPLVIASCRAMLWEPARYQGKPVEMILVLPVHFSLKK